MSRYLRIFVFGFGVTFGLTESAAAYCVQPRLFGSPSLAEQVNGQLEWMLCLHNEQVGSLNRHADQLNSQSESLRGLAGLIRMEGERVDGVLIRERNNSAERKALLQRISDLENRIKSLEQQID